MICNKQFRSDDSFLKHRKYSMAHKISKEKQRAKCVAAKIIADEVSSETKELHLREEDINFFTSCEKIFWYVGEVSPLSVTLIIYEVKKNWDIFIVTALDNDSGHIFRPIYLDRKSMTKALSKNGDNINVSNSKSSNTISRRSQRRYSIQMRKSSDLVEQNANDQNELEILIFDCLTAFTDEEGERNIVYSRKGDKFKPSQPLNFNLPPFVFDALKEGYGKRMNKSEYDAEVLKLNEDFRGVHKVVEEAEKSLNLIKKTVNIWKAPNTRSKKIKSRRGTVSEGMNEISDMTKMAVEKLKNPVTNGISDLKLPTVFPNAAIGVSNKLLSIEKETVSSISSSSSSSIYKSRRASISSTTSLASMKRASPVTSSSKRHFAKQTTVNNSTSKINLPNVENGTLRASSRQGKNSKRSGTTVIGSAPAALESRLLHEPSPYASNEKSKISPVILPYTAITPPIYTRTAEKRKPQGSPIRTKPIKPIFENAIPISDILATDETRDSERKRKDIISNAGGLTSWEVHVNNKHDDLDCIDSDEDDLSLDYQDDLFTYE